MYLEKYKISETVNNDRNPCFNNEGTYPYFQEELEGFKSFLISMVNNKQSSTFYKFGDGDYRFLKQDPTGSAAPGKRALSKPYDQINHQQFTEGAQNVITIPVKYTQKIEICFIRLLIKILIIPLNMDTG